MYERAEQLGFNPFKSIAKAVTGVAKIAKKAIIGGEPVQAGPVVIQVPRPDSTATSPAPNQAGMNQALIIGGAVVAGVLLFSMLKGRRR